MNTVKNKHFMIGGNAMNICTKKSHDFMKNCILYRLRLRGGQSKRLYMNA